MKRNLVDKLGLQPLAKEGGYFKRIFLSDKEMTMDAKKKSIGSAIYYYLESDDFSAWHQLACDEIWHFYTGSDLVLHTINNQGELQSIRLGDMANNEEAVACYVVPAQTWLAAEVGSDNAYALIGCTCFPAYDDRDCVLGNREELTKKFPQHKDIIHRLTREPK